jgi:hypothetical protein
MGFNLTKFKIPKLSAELLDPVSQASPSVSIASSLPEATGEHFQPRVASSVNLSTMGGPELLLLNPLGAGDTCSAIFLVEYLDTKVHFI